MSCPDSEYSITFLFEQLQDFNAPVPSKSTVPHGRPKSYADNSLIVLFAILTLKRIYSFQAQHRGLITPAVAIPSQPTKRAVSGDPVLTLPWMGLRYGLHLTVSLEGLPCMGIIDTNCVSEKVVLDQQFNQTEPTYNAPGTFSYHSYYIENDSDVEVGALYEFSHKILNAADNVFVVGETINEYGQWLDARDPDNPDQNLNENTEGTLGIDLTDYHGTYRIYAYTRLEL